MGESNEYGGLRQSDAKFALQAPDNVFGFGGFRGLYDEFLDVFDLPFLRLVALGLCDFPKDVEYLCRGEGLFGSDGFLKESPEGPLLAFEGLGHVPEVPNLFVAFLDHSGVGSGGFADGAYENGIAHAEFDAFVGGCDVVGGQVENGIEIDGILYGDLTQECGEDLLDEESTGDGFNVGKGLTEDTVGHAFPANPGGRYRIDDGLIGLDVRESGQNT